MSDVITVRDAITVFVGFLLGIVGSYIWWRYLLHLRPKVRISPIVLKGRSYLDPEVIVYRIKLINFGSRQVIDVSAEAWITKFSQQRWTPEQRLRLEYDGELPALGRRPDFGDTIREISPIFYMNILNETDLSAKLKEDRRLTFTLSAKDALSGTAVVQRRVYTAPDIQDGDFEVGFTFAAKPSQDALAGSSKDPTL